MTRRQPNPTRGRPQVVYPIGHKFKTWTVTEEVYVNGRRAYKLVCVCGCTAVRRPLAKMETPKLCDCRNKFDRNNPMWTAENVAKLREYAALEMNTMEIAEAFGVTPQMITGKAGSLRIKIRRVEPPAKVPLPTWPEGLKFEDATPSKSDGRGPVPKRCEVTSGSSSALSWGQ